MVSVRPAHCRVRCQQPVLGRSMIEGPGPPSTTRVAVADPSASVAVMRSDEPSATGETQRILLLWSAGGGAGSGWAQRIAAMSPPSPGTYGIRGRGSVNPVRAQSGSTRAATGSAQDAPGAVAV